MTKEDLLKQIDEYEVVVNGKVSQAAFAYPPTPDLRSGGVITDGMRDMMQRPLGPEIVIPRSMLDKLEKYEHNLHRGLINNGGFNVSDAAADALAMVINKIQTA